jgi:hypothetical protein
MFKLKLKFQTNDLISKVFDSVARCIIIFLSCFNLDSILERLDNKSIKIYYIKYSLYRTAQHFRFCSISY